MRSTMGMDTDTDTGTGTGTATEKDMGMGNLVMVAPVRMWKTRLRGLRIRVINP